MTQNNRNAWKSAFSRARAKARDEYRFKGYSQLINGRVVWFGQSFDGPLDIWKGALVDELEYARRKTYECLNDASIQPDQYRDPCQIDLIRGHRLTAIDRGFKLP